MRPARSRWTTTGRAGTTIGVARGPPPAPTTRPTRSARCSSTLAGRAAPGSTSCRRRRPLPAGAPARFDIVGLDPRGTNRSAPVRCFAHRRASRTSSSAACRSSRSASGRSPTSSPLPAVHPAVRAGGRADHRPRLDRELRPRPRPVPAGGRRPGLLLHRLLVRHYVGDDVRGALPEPGPGDRDRRRAGPGAVGHRPVRRRCGCCRSPPGSCPPRARTSRWARSSAPARPPDRTGAPSPARATTRRDLSARTPRWPAGPSGRPVDRCPTAA